ncbi:hypothetical protein QAD02_016599 [Eretmocerus hayati]|uniref:Uncharacterized protein n=1 Tax=Eretmocerus hayati TaxID=131215 RepID=A0ACC2PBX5_9HYME|nr:hypothetical protein QAD02_016599 [Eretmocerus hayati]
MMRSFDEDDDGEFVCSRRKIKRTTSGQVQESKQRSGPVAFTWNVNIDKTILKSWESPSFSFEDRSGIQHKWRLTFRTELTQEGCSDTEQNSLAIEYLADKKANDSIFAVRFCVFQITKFIFMPPIVHYVDESSKNVPQNFSEQRFRKITMPGIEDNHLQLEVLCTIIAISKVIEQDEVFLSQHEISLKKGYESLFESGKFSDVTFVVGKQRMQLHKSILSSRSVVFAAMFENNFQESISNEVHIDDASVEVMKEFFRYIYAAEIIDLKNNNIGLLILSNKYEVYELKSLCESSLVESLRKENVLEYLDLASLHNAKNLESECVRFIVSNAKQIVKLPGFSINKVQDDLRDELFKLVVERS